LKSFSILSRIVWRPSILSGALQQNFKGRHFNSRQEQNGAETIKLAMSDRALYESSNGDSSVWASAEP